MSKLTKPLATKSNHLVKVVYKQLKSTLLELVPLWQSEPHADWKRFVRPTGVGSFSISIESYSGIQSWISFRKKVEGKDCIRLLNTVIEENQPALFGYVSHSSSTQKIQGAIGLITCLCHVVSKYMESQPSVEVAIERALTEIEQILSKNIASEEIMTPLSGLKLPEDIDQIDIGKNVILRCLTATEISDIGSNDISSETRYDISSRFVTTAIIFTRDVRITVSEQYEQLIPDLHFHQEAQDQIDAVLCALHILKTGRVGVVASFRTLRPTVLPNMSGHSSSPLVVNPFAFMELDHEEVKLFIDLHNKIILNKRDEVRIAATRLVDAESRLSPVDALLDAVIGLEVLLNPNDYAELSFRVALNYAYIGNPIDRRKRYENVRDIQKTRNRVVHGGLNLASKDAALIHEHAALAKACLRDSITRFLTDIAFSSRKKLDADFWLDRVIPPNV